MRRSWIGESMQFITRKEYLDAAGDDLLERTRRSDLWYLVPRTVAVISSYLKLQDRGCGRAPRFQGIRRLTGLGYGEISSITARFPLLVDVRSALDLVCGGLRSPWNISRLTPEDQEILRAALGRIQPPGLGAELKRHLLIEPRLSWISFDLFAAMGTRWQPLSVATCLRNAVYAETLKREIGTDPPATLLLSEMRRWAVGSGKNTPAIQ